MKPTRVGLCQKQEVQPHAFFPPFLYLPPYNKKAQKCSAPKARCKCKERQSNTNPARRL